MTSEPYRLKLKIPSNLEYVAPIRKFVSEVLIVNNYSQKFAYRSEVIVDEVCTNAIVYGCNTLDAYVDFSCEIYSDRIELQVKDQGGQSKDVDRLKLAIGSEEKIENYGKVDYFGKNPCDGCMGLEIVRMLSEEVELSIDENNVTSLRVVRRRKSGNGKNTN